MNIFDTILVNPIINILVAIYQLFAYLHVPYALGFAIILMTILIRLLLLPFTASQIRTTKKMQELAPHISKIKEKHKGDTKQQHAATMALYKEHNINPASGCLPGLVQIVILLFGLYPALLKVINVSPEQSLKLINHLVYFPFLKLSHPWDTSFLGLALGKNPAELMAALGGVVLLIPILTGLLQFIQSKMMIPSQEEKSKEKKEKKTSQEDFATTFQKQSLYLLPVMIGFFSFKFSIGLSLYWNTFTIFGIIQQYKMQGLGSLSEWVKRIKPAK